MKLCTLFRAATLAAMFRRFPLLPALRCLILGLLVLGLLANPVLAASCGIADAQHLMEGEAHAPGDQSPEAEEWCCPDQDCRACCTYNASPTSVPGISVVISVAAPLPGMVIGFEPGGHSVLFRPPIVG